ncbi:interferon-induced transmembrane protein 1 [Betta splendens]|uniref:Interferon-induced transmembrane protein 1 n=1 Tax=Betta splendens TaxID=158456 RepID=A0A6P7MVR9_BETSP|nr:interferon-induced transmembrane protein 1 [Betta splendens]
MNPAYYPAEAAPLQAVRQDGLPGQPGAPALVQYTTVNVPAEPPKDHIIWSLFCFVYSNPCCLGLAALIYSIKARDRKMLGDIQGAKTYAATARQLNIASTILAAVGFFIFIITIISISVSAANAYPRYRY